MTDLFWDYPIILYGCQTWSLTLTEEDKLCLKTWY